jgi:hypothetical protein
MSRPLATAPVEKISTNKGDAGPPQPLQAVERRLPTHLVVAEDRRPGPSAGVNLLQPAVLAVNDVFYGQRETSNPDPIVDYVSREEVALRLVMAGLLRTRDGPGALRYGRALGALRDDPDRRSESEQDALPAPTIYWPLDRLDIIWFDLNANSYYGVGQQAGSVFSRAMALECTRRTTLVRPFELDRLGRDAVFLPANRVWEQERLFSGDRNSEPPTRDDLLKLCADRELDFVVARQGFPGLYAATNGTWFIYDCRDLRTCVGPTSHTPPDSGDTTGEQR